MNVEERTPGRAQQARLRRIAAACGMKQYQLLALLLDKLEAEALIAARSTLMDSPTPRNGMPLSPAAAVPTAHEKEEPAPVVHYTLAYSCEHCGKRFRTKQGLAGHRSWHTSGSRKGKRTLIASVPRMTCPWCDENLPNNIAGTSHIERCARLAAKITAPKGDQ